MFLKEENARNVASLGIHELEKRKHITFELQGDDFQGHWNKFQSVKNNDDNNNNNNKNNKYGVVKKRVNHRSEEKMH